MIALWPATEQWKEAAAWLAGGLTVMALCLLATFPYDALHARMMAEITRGTGMDVRVSDWSVGMPLGLDWRNVTLTQPNGDPLHLAFLQTRIGLLKALTGGLSVDVVAQENETTTKTGVIKGHLTASSYSFAGPLAVKGRVQQVDLSKVARRYVSHGLLTGEFSHRVESGQAPIGAMRGEGSWKAEIKDLTVDGIPIGMGKTLSLTFSEVSGSGTCRDAVCDLTGVKGDGLDGSFTGSGKLTLQQPLHNSLVAFTVTVVPGAGFTSKAGALGLPPLPPGTPMTVKIQGTLAQARIAL